MLEKIKKGDPWLYNCVRAVIAIIMVVSFIIAIVLWTDTESFLIGLISIASGIVVSVYLWIQYLIAGYFYSAAIDKGYTDVAYIRIAFFLGIVGYLLVCALPDVKPVDKTKKSSGKKQTKVNKNEEFATGNDSYQEVEEYYYIVDDDDDMTVPKKKCPKCGALHDFDCPKCPVCKHNYYEN